MAGTHLSFKPFNQHSWLKTSQADYSSLVHAFRASRAGSARIRKQQQRIRPPFKCLASTSPPPLLLWAIEAAEDPDLTGRLVSVAAVDIGIAVLLATSFLNTWASRKRGGFILEDYAHPGASRRREENLLKRFQNFLYRTANSIPTGASLLILAEQEASMTDEDGALEDCLVQGIEEDKDLAAAFLVLFITGFKRTWLSNTVSEAIMTSCCQQRCSIQAAAMLLDKVCKPKATFKAPIETLMVNGDLMEAIAIYSLVTVMRTKKLFTWIDSLKIDSLKGVM